MRGRRLQNNIDLVRLILESIRDRSDLWPKEVQIAGYDELLVARHVERLFDDKLIEGVQHRALSSPVSTIMVRDMSSAGHEFLSALESADVWERLKSALNPTELSAMSFKELAGIAKELAAKAIRRKLGLDD